MGEFSEWYSTFLTDLPGGGIPMHRKRPPPNASGKKKGERERLGTPDYQSFVRDMHRIETLERRKLHSLPELERAMSPDVKRRAKKEQLDGATSTASLPAIWSAVDLTGKPSLKGCKTFLTQCLDPRTRRQTAQVLVLDGWGDDHNVSPDLENKKMFKPKHVEHVGWAPDDLVNWQKGLLEKDAAGKPVMKQEELREYDDDCIDVGLTLLKAKKMVKLLGVQRRMMATIDVVKKKVKADFEDGRIDSMEHIATTHQAPDFVWENRKEVLAQRKEIRRSMLLQACSKRAKNNLSVQQRALHNEIEWKQEVERKLFDRQERQHRRIQQTKWLPVFFVVMAGLRMRNKVQKAKDFQNSMMTRSKAVMAIQRAYREINKRKGCINLSLTALRVVQRKVRCWIIGIRERLKHKKVDVVKEILQEYVKMRSIAIYVGKFKKNVINCQRIIRAFLHAMHLRHREMGRQWDMVARDIIGDDSGRQWMHRLLNQAKVDASGKLVQASDTNTELQTFKDAKIFIEIRKMRREYLEKLENYGTEVRVFRAKVDMYSQMQSMGMDPEMLRAKLGISCMVPKPRMTVYAPRSIVRHSVEMGLKQLGIMEFVDEMMEAELNDKINKLMENLLQKFTFMLRNNMKARDVFDEIDEDKSGTLEEEELKAFLEKLEIKANYQEVRVLFARLDYSGDGSLSYHEFMDRLNNWKKNGKTAEKKRLAGKGKVEPRAPSSSSAGQVPQIGRTSSKGIARTPSVRPPPGIGRTESTKGSAAQGPGGRSFKRVPSVVKK